MSDDLSTIRKRPGAVAPGTASVTELATRRQSSDVLRSITLIFGGVHYGTFSVSTPYTKGRPIALYVVPQGEDWGGEVFGGPLDCLLTDDPALGADLHVAQ